MGNALNLEAGHHGQMSVRANARANDRNIVKRARLGVKTYRPKAKHSQVQAFSTLDTGRQGATIAAMAGPAETGAGRSDRTKYGLFRIPPANQRSSFPQNSECNGIAASDWPITKHWARFASVWDLRSCGGFNPALKPLFFKKMTSQIHFGDATAPGSDKERIVWIKPSSFASPVATKFLS